MSFDFRETRLTNDYKCILELVNRSQFIHIVSTEGDPPERYEIRFSCRGVERLNGNKAVYLALGFTIEGHKEVLGLWIEQTEGAKFWLSVLTELKNRGVNDILIACVDGLTGFPDAIEAAFPKTTTQLCIVHMVRNSLKFVSWKDRKALVAALKRVYQSATAEEALSELETLKAA